jgi:hypothetical protein
MTITLASRPEIPFEVLEEARHQWRANHTIEWIEWQLCPHPGRFRGRVGWTIRLVPSDRRRDYWDIFFPVKPDDSPAVAVNCEVC